MVESLPQIPEYRRHKLRNLMMALAIVIMNPGCMRLLHAVEIGSKLGDFHAMDASGGVQSSRLYPGKIVVLFFWSFKCPVSLAYADRMVEFQNKYRNRGVVLLGVAAAANESQEEIRANAANLKITAPILVDSDGELMDRLEATHTPSVYILDQNGVLRYKGAPDNNKMPEDKGRVSYMDDAVESLLDGRPINTPETQVFGCSIKRRRIRE